MLAEVEAFTLGLGTARGLTPNTEHIIVATDSQCLLRKLEAGWSPPSGGSSPRGDMGLLP